MVINFPDKIKYEDYSIWASLHVPVTPVNTNHNKGKWSGREADVSSSLTRDSNIIDFRKD